MHVSASFFLFALLNVCACFTSLSILRYLSKWGDNQGMGGHGGVGRGDASATRGECKDNRRTRAKSLGLPTRQRRTHRCSSRFSSVSVASRSLAIAGPVSWTVLLLAPLLVGAAAWQCPSRASENGRGGVPQLSGGGGVKGRPSPCVTKGSLPSRVDVSRRGGRVRSERWCVRAWRRRLLLAEQVHAMKKSSARRDSAGASFLLGGGGCSHEELHATVWVPP